MLWEPFIHRLGETFRIVFTSWMCLISLELLFPLERQSFRSYLRGIRNTFVIIPITSLISVVLLSILPLLAVKPFVLDLPPYLEPFAPLLSFFLGDVCYYWMHRFQHTNFWWRFHKPHHDLKELNAVNSSSHWMEAFTSFIFQTIPLMFFSVPSGSWTIPIFSFLFVWGFYIHANTSVNLGILRFLFADPQYHRVHHSIDEKHWGKNFAAFFPIIDIVFGTAYFPKKERLKTSKKGQIEPRLAEFLR